jgi:hypothetical protein
MVCKKYLRHVVMNKHDVDAIETLIDWIYNVLIYNGVDTTTSLRFLGRLFRM